MAARPTVVLIHGLFGFRKLLWLEYFHGVRQLYDSMGLRVLALSLPWAGSIDQRAHALAQQLADEPGPLHLLAHSMGGLDARYWITHLSGAGKTVSLTTLSTPHHGSAAADLVCQAYSPFRLFAGVCDLTTNHLKIFNAATPNHPDVIYRSYSAARPVAEHPWIVRHQGRYIQRLEGNNDAQVSLQSATWGEHINTLPCDHFELIARNFWFNPFHSRESFDPMPMYRDIGNWILRH
ncbi:MAG: alpha/beta fold hydrolase [Mariprofundus sp.]|nr:alpha/beta fold hydrolase [Mariprofundus sp.]